MSRRIPTNLPGSVRKWSGAAPGSLTHFGFKKVNSEAPYPTIRAYKQVNFDIVGSIPTKAERPCGQMVKPTASGAVELFDVVFLTWTLDFLFDPLV